MHIHMLYSRQGVYMWKKCIFSSRICKIRMTSLHREMKKCLLCKIAWGEENLSIIDAPLICEVRGVSAMAKIHYKNPEVE
jgi:hypothetical protein